MSNPIISLDLETSSLDPQHGEILSIALVNFETGAYYYSNITYSSLEVQPEAMRVNQITWEDIDPVLNRYIKDPRTIQSETLGWMTLQGIPDRAKTTALGKNVGSLDLNFLKHKMPALCGRFTYRAIDLNSLWRLVADREGKDFEGFRIEAHAHAVKSTTNFVKHSSELGRIKSHHALYDAYFNCFAYAALLKPSQIPNWMKEENWKGQP